MVVDDEPDITFTLKKGLENSGLFEVDMSNDPLEVLSNFKPGYYDCYSLILGCQIRDIDSKVKSCFITAYEINYQVRDMIIRVTPNSIRAKEIMVERKIKQETF